MPGASQKGSSSPPSSRNFRLLPHCFHQDNRVFFSCPHPAYRPGPSIKLTDHLLREIRFLSHRFHQDKQISLVSSADPEVFIEIGGIQRPPGSLRSLDLERANLELDKLDVHRACACRRELRTHLRSGAMGGFD